MDEFGFTESFEDIVIDSDFDEFDFDEEENSTVIIDTKYRKDGKPIVYDKMAEEFYKNLRKLKMDPISLEIVPDSIAFKFYDQWDPYTGERLGRDPYGPLYFYPAHITYYFYKNRYKHLWINPLDEGADGGYYAGYYSDGVGSGKDFNIKSRGSFPERYLFRLPIQNCYLTEDHNRQIPTFGPMLTDSEIIKLDSNLQLLKKEYKKIYGKYPVSLVKLKSLYDAAICREAPIKNSQVYSSDKLKELRYKSNCVAVDTLVKL